MYQGEYHGSKKHEPDLDAVLERSWKHGLEKMIITGGSFNDAKSAIAMAKTDGNWKQNLIIHLSLYSLYLQTDFLQLSDVIPQDVMNSRIAMEARVSTCQACSI